VEIYVRRALDGKWWNFVAGDRASIAEAQRQWENGDSRFGAVGDGSAQRLMPPALPPGWG
jgi:hypothetical protein